MSSKKVYRAVGIDNYAISKTCQTEAEALQYKEKFEKRYPELTFKVQYALDWQDADIYNG